MTRKQVKKILFEEFSAQPIVKNVAVPIKVTLEKTWYNPDSGETSVWAGKLYTNEKDFLGAWQVFGGADYGGKWTIKISTPDDKQPEGLQLPIYQKAADAIRKYTKHDRATKITWVPQDDILVAGHGGRKYR